MYGSRISLISRRNIRYIGTLNDVNEAEKTISLEHVCSMGTEGRAGDPQSEIPPCDDIYEYIQFRATDVLSVQFESETQAPPPPPPPQVPNDPAILEARPRAKDQGAAPISAGAPPSHSVSAGPAQAQAQAQPVAQGSSSAAIAAPVETEVRQKPSYIADAEELQADNQYRSSGHVNRGGYVPRGGRGGYVPRGGANTWRGARGGRGGYQARHGSGRPVEVPESDFDFESSNSKLNKDDLAKEFAKLNVQFSDDSISDVATPAASTSVMAGPSTSSVAATASSSNTGAYTQKSFFDDISCEAKERMQMQEFGLSYEERRNRIHAERQQNYETFGQATSDQAQLRYNRFQNSRGRGGAGAPNGYYHNTSNYNNNSSSWRGGRGGRGGYQRGGYRNQPARDPGAATEAST
ncbi:hypothetical protein H4218_006300 [Coemansia sp. IMI 209128]|nr:hypothetical protein GGI10_004163 [Coemansia sp. RSA 2530]KAJ2692668.1 hypothetical protein H4218_006300 [Coemansia sp. IMI 209128]